MIGHTELDGDRYLENDLAAIIYHVPPFLDIQEISRSLETAVLTSLQIPRHSLSTDYTLSVCQGEPSGTSGNWRDRRSLGLTRSETIRHL